MFRENDKQEFSGAAKVWEDFAAQHPELDAESTGVDALISDQFRDEYVRLPYDEVPQSQECSW